MSLRKLLGKRKHIEYKYNLNLWLLQSDKKDYYLRSLPTLCGVSPGTFNNWRYIKQNQCMEIPHSAIVKICRFMGKDIGLFQIETPADTENRIIKK